MLAFMLISLGVGFVTATIPPIADSEIPPFGQPLHGVVGGALGVALAFLVTAGLSGRAGVADLGRRSVRWRVPVRWYLIALFSVPVAAALISLAFYGPRALAAPSGGWPRALAEVAAFFFAATGVLPTCRGGWIHRVPPASLAGPLQPNEAHLVRGAAVGGMAYARPLRRGRLGT